MRGFLAPTDYDWFRFLRSREGIDEVNFWRPSGRQEFRVLQPGEPFFFKLKAPHNAVGGFGLFAGFKRLPDWLAWEAFGVKNGAADLAQLRRLLGRYTDDPKGEIGCVMLTSPVFFPDGAFVEQPRDWKREAVRGKSYDLASGEGRRILEECLARAAATAPALVFEEAGARFGEPSLVRQRLGQGTFRVLVTDAYRGACAVTSEHSLPVLEAAHIRPYSSGGEHRLNNGILLRTDIHRLFDHGYVTITPDLRFRVSPRLREEWSNGRTYYELEGRPVRVPEDPGATPDRALLAWHGRSRFRG